MDINQKINLVKNNMFEKFPNCSYTINILIWNDGTDLVECRYGSIDGKKIYTSTYYNNKLNFEEIDVDGKVMIKDKFGNNNYYYLKNTLN